MPTSPNDASNDTERSGDPILFEVIRNALVEVTEEMSVSLQRTAFFTNVKTRLDYSCAFVDAEGRVRFRGDRPAALGPDERQPDPDLHGLRLRPEVPDRS